MLLVGGIAAASYCTTSFFGLCLGHPYAAAGGALAALGFVLLLVGIILAVLEGPASVPVPGYPSVGFPPAPYGYYANYPTASPLPPPPTVPVMSPYFPARLCLSCGAGGPSGAAFCHSCGKPLPQ